MKEEKKEGWGGEAKCRNGEGTVLCGERKNGEEEGWKRKKGEKRKGRLWKKKLKMYIKYKNN